MQQEFSNIFMKYYGPVKSFVKKLVRAEADAEDITQDVFTNLWGRPDVWRHNDEVGKYIFRMARYQSLNFIRDNARVVENGLVDAGIDMVEKVGSEVGATDKLIHDEAELLLEMGMERMPEKRRRIFSMSRLEGLGNKEIADKLGLSVRTVESHIYSALCELKALFDRK